jgi:hypothetical protein
MKGHKRTQSESTQASNLDRSSDCDLGARMLIIEKITEQENIMNKAMNDLETLKPLLTGRLQSGSRMGICLTLTQIKTLESKRDHALGLIGSLDQLCSRANFYDYDEIAARVAEIVAVQPPPKASFREEDGRGLKELRRMLKPYTSSEPVQCQ